MTILRAPKKVHLANISSGVESRQFLKIKTVVRKVTGAAEMFTCKISFTQGGGGLRDVSKTSWFMLLLLYEYFLICRHRPSKN